MTADTPGPALLVVDDNEDNRYTLVQRLRRLGYADVATAVDGREALAQLGARPFDLVLLDVMMPELNGHEVLERMRADERLRHVPVIMISALDQVDSVVRCIELGAEDYLPKPFNPVILRARHHVSRKKRLRDQELRRASFRLTVLRVAERDRDHGFLAVHRRDGLSAREREVEAPLFFAAAHIDDDRQSLADARRPADAPRFSLRTPYSAEASR